MRQRRTGGPRLRRRTERAVRDCRVAWVRYFAALLAYQTSAGRGWAALFGAERAAGREVVAAFAPFLTVLLRDGTALAPLAPHLPAVGRALRLGPGSAPETVLAEAGAYADTLRAGIEAGARAACVA